MQSSYQVFNFANITTAESTLLQQKEMQRRSRSPSNSSLNHALKPEEDWTKISDLAERRRIQNRIAQRNYRKKLKKRLEDLEKRADSSPPSDTDSPPHVSPRLSHIGEKEDPQSTRPNNQLTPDLFFDNAIGMQSRQISQSSHSSFSDIGSPPLQQTTFEYPQQYLPLPNSNMDAGMFTDPNLPWYDIHPTWQSFPDPATSMLPYDPTVPPSHEGYYLNAPAQNPPTGKGQSYDDVSLLPDMRDRYLQLMSAGHLDDEEFFGALNDNLEPSMDTWHYGYKANMFHQSYNSLGLEEDSSSTSSASDTLTSDHHDDSFTHKAYE